MLKRGKCKITMVDDNINWLKHKEVEGYYIEFLGQKMFICHTQDKNYKGTFSLIEPETGTILCLFLTLTVPLKNVASMVEEMFKNQESFSIAYKDKIKKLKIEYF